MQSPIPWHGKNRVGLSPVTQNRLVVRTCSYSCFGALLTLALCLPSLSALPIRPQETQAGQQKPEVTHAVPRGKKLILTDGSFHMVRSYERQGDRVGGTRIHGHLVAMDPEVDQREEGPHARHLPQLHERRERPNRFVIGDECVTVPGEIA